MSYAQRVRRALRRAFRPPRRLRLLRPGTFLIVWTLALGLATLNTGNNVLYLLMGALLGLIALSGWLSELTLRDVHVQRTPPGAVTAGDRVRIEYRVTNGSARQAAHGLEIREIVNEEADPAHLPVLTPAWIQEVAPQSDIPARGHFRAERRGVYALTGVTVATTFPFGLFIKERDLECAGSITVWPRTDRRVRVPAPAGRSARRALESERAGAGTGRGDYRGLREYRQGDDPRDVHWRSTARRGSLIVREYEQDAAEEYWVVLDTVAPDAEAGEVAVEIAASLIASAALRGDRCGLAAGSVRIRPGAAAGRTEALLDVLASVVLTTAGPLPEPPAAPSACLLVTARSSDGRGWGDIFTTSDIA